MWVCLRTKSGEEGEKERKQKAHIHREAHTADVAASRSQNRPTLTTSARLPLARGSTLLPPSGAPARRPLRIGGGAKAEEVRGCCRESFGVAVHTRVCVCVCVCVRLMSPASEWRVFCCCCCFASTPSSARGTTCAARTGAQTRRESIGQRGGRCKVDVGEGGGWDTSQQKIFTLL